MARVEIGTLVLVTAFVAGVALPGGKAGADLQGGGCAIGPDCPVVAASGTSQTSLATGSSVQMIFDSTSSRYTIDGPWDCDAGDGDNEFLARNPDALGRFRAIQRISDGGKLQRLKFTNFDGGRPTGAKLRDGDRIWNLKLVDSDSDGIFDAVRASSIGQPTTVVSLVTVDANEDGDADYITIPFALLPSGMVDSDDDCADAQPFVPLTRNGALKLDLDGDGAKDPTTFKSVSFTKPS